MTPKTCSAVRRRLSAFHDGELPIEERTAVQEHLRTCVPCADEAQSLKELSSALRLAATEHVEEAAEDLAGLPGTVVSRISAERNESVGARLIRAFEAPHLAWAALGATSSAVVCAAVILGLFYFGVRENPYSLKAWFAALSSPGSNENPVIVDGWVNPPSFIVAASGLPEEVGAEISEQDLVLALSAVITREGGVKGIELIQTGGPPRDAESKAKRQAILDLMDAISRARLSPARLGNSPVAVKVVLLYTHLTVRGKVPTELRTPGRALSLWLRSDETGPLAA